MFDFFFFSLQQVTPLSTGRKGTILIAHVINALDLVQARAAGPAQVREKSSFIQLSLHSNPWQKEKQ